MKKKKLKKILIGIAVALVSVIVIFAIAVFAIWHNEIASIASIRMLVEAKEENKSAPVYIMDVKGNYYFDDFIEQGGVSSDAELIDFIVGNITKGLVPMNIKSKISDVRHLRLRMNRETDILEEIMIFRQLRG